MLSPNCFWENLQNLPIIIRSSPSSQDRVQKKTSNWPLANMTLWSLSPEMSSGMFILQNYGLLSKNKDQNIITNWSLLRGVQVSKGHLIMANMSKNNEDRYVIKLGSDQVHGQTQRSQNFCRVKKNLNRPRIKPVTRSMDSVNTHAFTTLVS